MQDYGGIGGDFTLVDQHGAPFELQGLRGQAAMLFFGYTYCPDICPVTLSKMGRVYQLLGEDQQELTTLFVTVDPKRDTQEKLAEYLDYFALDAIGLRGDKEEIDQVKVSHLSVGANHDHASMVPTIPKRPRRGAGRQTGVLLSRSLDLYLPDSGSAGQGALSRSSSARATAQS